MSSPTLSPAVLAALERFRPLLPSREFDRLVEVLSQDLAPALRVNLLKHDPLDFTRRLNERYGWKFSPVPFCPSGFNLDGATENLGKTSEHALGEYYIQESASMLPVEMFDFPKNSSPLILDMAASPGGKTTHLVDRSKDQALIIANDASSGRISALRTVLAKWGAINQAITCLHGEYFGSQYPETFDAVLLDAPCSMQNLYDTPSHPLREVSAGEQQGLSNRQFLLLRSALQAVKVGGQVVYSTCTLSPEEDEQVVQRILEEFGEAVRLDDLSQKIPLPAPALLQDGKQTFSPHMGNALRLWPHIYGTTGFFTARFTKLDRLQFSTEPLPTPTRKASQPGMLPSAQQQHIYEWVRNFYGFDLAEVLQRQQVEMAELGNAIQLVPGRLYRDLPGIPIHSSGMQAFKRIPSGFQISHEFAARFGHQFQHGSVILNKEQYGSFLQHQDIPGMYISADLVGKTLLVKDEHGRILGRAKALKDRLKNLLPPRLL